MHSIFVLSQSYEINTTTFRMFLRFDDWLIYSETRYRLWQHTALNAVTCTLLDVWRLANQRQYNLHVIAWRIILQTDPQSRDSRVLFTSLERKPSRDSKLTLPLFLYRLLSLPFLKGTLSLDDTVEAKARFHKPKPTKEPIVLPNPEGITGLVKTDCMEQDEYGELKTIHTSRHRDCVSFAGIQNNSARWWHQVDLV